MPQINPGVINGGQYNASPETLEDGQTSPLQMDTSGNLKVALASGATDQDVNLVGINGVAPSNAGPLPTRAQSGATPTLTSANSAATSAQLLAAAATRIGVVIVNTDANALYIKYGTTATTAIGGYTYVIPSGGTFEMPAGAIYTGRIDGIWAADGAGGASITELTP